jgi:glycosyltransferase involved in cell wall biosynthesis
MYKIVTSNSIVMVLSERLSNKKDFYLINPSRLDDLWFKEHKNVSLDKIKLLYVGRINPEKGIYNFIKMFNQINLDIELSIVGEKKDLKVANKNIKVLGYISNPKSLIDVYDSHNIVVLPSFTEGQPYILDECLSRKRPIIIFEDITYIVKDRKGVFVSKRNMDSFVKTVKYIMQNYKKIEENIEKNKFVTKENMLKQIYNTISSNE